MKKKYTTPMVEIYNSHPASIVCASGLKAVVKDGDEEETIIDYGGESSASGSGFDGID